MQSIVDVFFFRGIERWIVVLGGIFFAYLGYKLFLYGVDQGNGKLETESQFFKLTFSGSGPGLFFMAFGAIVLVSSIYSTAERTRETTNPGDASGSDLKGTGKASVTRETTSFSGKGKIYVCDLLRQQKGDVEGIFWTYSNKIDNKKMKTFADTVKKQVLAEDKRQELLLAVEEVICDLEK
jgi:hypothetical protein